VESDSPLTLTSMSRFILGLRHEERRLEAFYA
jgi:hypothetical protein